MPSVPNFQIVRIALKVLSLYTDHQLYSSTHASSSHSIVFLSLRIQTAWWTEAFIGIHITEDFVLEFWGSQGNTLLSNIAVDDIDVKPAVCPGEV